MSDVNLSISQDVIRPIIEQKMKTALMEAMGTDLTRIADDMLTKYLMQPVDSEGRPSTYSSGRRLTRMDWLFQNIIQDSVKNAVLKVATEKEKELTAQVEAYFKSRQGTNKFVKAVGEGLIKNLHNAWRFSVSVHIPSDN